VRILLALDARRITQIGSLTAPLALALALALAPRPAPAQLIEAEGIRVAVSASLSPRALPRRLPSPVAFTISGRIEGTDGIDPPRLHRLAIAINPAGRLSAAGLPRCRLAQIQPASERQALAACAGALVGSGAFTSVLTLPGQPSFRSSGHILAFNAGSAERPVILAHLYGAKPTATSAVIPFAIVRRSDATVLRATISGLSGRWGRLLAFRLRLARTYSYRGARRSYLTASCPAPPGIAEAAFPLARASFSFAGARRLSATLNSSCRVRQ
jgi:hypothetical protein